MTEAFTFPLEKRASCPVDLIRTFPPSDSMVFTQSAKSFMPENSGTAFSGMLITFAVALSGLRVMPSRTSGVPW